MEYLKRWTRPSNYMGETWYDYYSAGVGQTRDSDALERANFQAMQQRLSAVREDGLDDDGSGWTVVRENHWAVGWIEWIAIHESCAGVLACADSIMVAFQDYPCIDEDLYGQIEDEDCAETWESCYDPSERIRYFRDHSFTGGFRDLIAAVRGSWCHAANLLHCPSDILC
jgi:hypothetical protein